MTTNNFKIRIRDEIMSGDNEPFYCIFLDDEPEILDFVGGLLGEYGLKAFTTLDPNAAVEFFEKNRSKVACIISDVKMPLMNGFQFRERIKLMGAGTPFAILSAYVDREMAMRGVELQISAFIEKPVNTAKLESFLKDQVLSFVRTLKEDAELLTGFIQEASQNLDTAEEIALLLEQDPTNIEHINKLFGLVHTIKGSSGFFEPKTLSRFAHKFEDTLKKIQRNEIDLSDALVTGILKSLDVLKDLVGEFRTGVHGNHDVDALEEDIFGNIRNGDSNAKAEKVPVNPIHLQPGNLESSNKGSNNGHCSNAKNDKELKVSVALLDEFVFMSGEMTVVRNMINKSVKAIEKRFGSDSDVQMLTEFLNELHKINANVQSKVTELRKVGMKSIYKPLPRTIRDLSKSLGKETEFKLLGEDLRVDNAIAEALNQSLIHIVRNSADHGLEMPEQRKKLGKPATGLIQINTEIRNDEVVVSIKDDGHGIDVDRIRSKLIKNGSHTEQEVRQMQNDELYQMIFSSGFSTAEKVTDVSGRGVGMSMVKDSIEALGGRIVIESELNKGSVFSLVIPIPKSVLIKNCLFVKIGEHEFALPQDSIFKVVCISAEEQRTQIDLLEGTKVLRIADDLIPVVSVHSLLQIKDPLSWDERTEIRLIIVSDQKSKIAIIVDQIGDVEDTVIKPLQGKIKALSVYQGATFLGDGRVGLVLSVEGLIASVGISNQVSAIKRELHRKRELKETEMNNRSTASECSLVLFHLESPGVFAFRQEEILRIEEFEWSQMRKVSDRWMIPYRDRLLVVIDLGNLVFRKPMQLEDKVTLVVVQSASGSYIGFSVRKILDIVISKSDLIPNIDDSIFGVEGNFIIDSKVVTLLGVKEVISLLNESSLSIDDRPDENDLGARDVA